MWQGAPLLTSTLIKRTGGGEVLEERPQFTQCDKVRRPQNRINISSGQRPNCSHISKQSADANSLGFSQFTLFV